MKKKIISLILTMTLLLSCAFVMPVSAADEEDGGFGVIDILGGQEGVDEFKNALNNYDPNKKPPDDTENIDELLASGALDNCSMLGVSIDFLYNSTDPINWGSLYELDEEGNVLFFDKNGVQVPQSAGGVPKLAVTKQDITLAKANLNLYLRRVITKNYSGTKLLTSEVATALTNMLGNMFYPNYNNQVIEFKGTQGVSEDEFYRIIVEKSGLGSLIQQNWCNQPSVNFKPVLVLFGISLSNILESEYGNGQILGEKILKSAIQRIMSEGPINFLLNLIWSYARTYEAVLYQPTKALFSLKINSGMIDYEEMKTFDGLINLIANNNDKADLSKMQFLTTPARKFALAGGTSELFLYLLVYLNLNCRYKNNTAVIEEYKTKIDNFKMSTSDKQYVVKIIDGLLSGRIDKLVDELGVLYVENIEQVPNDFWRSFKNTIIKFLQKIVDFFDNWFKVISGEKDYGT